MKHDIFTPFYTFNKNCFYNITLSLLLLKFNIINLSLTPLAHRVDPPGMPKSPEPCQSDIDCIETETCYSGICTDPCEIDSVCAPTAQCKPIKHRPMCSCPSGHEGNPTIKCSPITQCKNNTPNAIPKETHICSKLIKRTLTKK